MSSKLLLIVSSALILASACALIAASESSDAENYDLWVFGIQVTDDNCDNIMVGDPFLEKYVITFKDNVLTIPSLSVQLGPEHIHNESAIYSELQDLTIKFADNVTFESLMSNCDNFIEAKNVTLCPTGQSSNVMLTTKWNGITAEDNITIGKGVDLRIYCRTGSVLRYYPVCGIDASTLNVPDGSNLTVFISNGEEESGYSDYAIGVKAEALTVRNGSVKVEVKATEIAVGLQLRNDIDVVTDKIMDITATSFNGKAFGIIIDYRNDGTIDCIDTRGSSDGLKVCVIARCEENEIAAGISAYDIENTRFNNCGNLCILGRASVTLTSDGEGSITGYGVLLHSLKVGEEGDKNGSSLLIEVQATDAFGIGIEGDEEISPALLASGSSNISVNANGSVNQYAISVTLLNLQNFNRIIATTSGAGTTTHGVIVKQVAELSSTDKLQTNADLYFGKLNIGENTFYIDNGKDPSGNVIDKVKTSRENPVDIRVNDPSKPLLMVKLITIQFETNNPEYGTVDKESIQVPAQEPWTAAHNVFIIEKERVTCTETPKTDKTEYSFRDWYVDGEGLSVDYIFYDDAKLTANIDKFNLHMIMIGMNGGVFLEQPEGWTGIKDEETIIGYYMNQREGEDLELPAGIPSKESIEDVGFTFSSWKGYTKDMKVTGPAVFKAVFVGTVIAYQIEDGMATVKCNDDLVSIPMNMINSVIETMQNGDADSLEFTMSIGTITLSKDTVLGMNKDYSFSLEYGTEKDVPQSLKEKVGDRPIILLDYSDKDIPSAISVRYTLREGEISDLLSVWYLKDNGTYEALECSYADGVLSFDTDHNSVYAIMYPEPSPEEGISVFIIGLGVLTAIILLSLVVYHFRGRP